MPPGRRERSPREGRPSQTLGGVVSHRATGHPAPRRVLVVQPAFLGDTVFLGPAVRALKSRWPGSEVGIVVSPRGEAVARGLPGVDEVFVFDKRRADAGLRGILRLGARLRAFAPDVALVSHPSARSGSVAWLSRAPRRIGYAPLCNDRVVLDRGRPFVERSLALVARAGAPVDDRRLALDPPPGLAAYAGEVLRGSGRPVIGIVPGAEWATKRWGEERYAELAARLRPPAARPCSCWEVRTSGRWPAPSSRAAGRAPSTPPETRSRRRSRCSRAATSWWAATRGSCTAPGRWAAPPSSSSDPPTRRGTCWRNGSAWSGWTSSAPRVTTTDRSGARSGTTGA